MKKLKDDAVRQLITGENPEGLEQLQFVKAGAGAGKTHSIKHRILNLVKQKELKPERLVAITYTTKAANELIVRIREVLEVELQNEAISSEDRENITTFLSTMAFAKISTFHSFCYDLLREYPIEFNVDPEAEIGDERGLGEIYNFCLEQMKEELRDIKGHDFEESLRALNELEEMESTKTLPILKELYSNRDLKCLSVDDGSHAMAEIKKTVLGMKAAFGEMDSLVSDHSDKLYSHYLEDVKPFFDKFSDDDEMVVALCKRETNVAKANKGKKTSYSRDGFVDEIKAHIKATSAALLKYTHIEALKAYNLSLKVFPYFCALVEEYKRNYGQIDFFDCLFKVKRGLANNPHLRELVQKRFDVIIVDEFQDSDPMQAEIAWLMAEDNLKKLFFVGDPKQSIYGFSRADISVYQGVMAEVAKKKEGNVLTLTTNFRSAAPVLDFVNENFSKILVKDKKHPDVSVDYEKMDVCPSNEKLQGGVYRWNLLCSGTSGETREQNAFIVASEIKKLLSKGYSPGDFLILFRTGTAMSAFEAALESLEIPVINTKSKDFLSKSDVQDLLNIIAYVARPSIKLYKYAAKRSPLMQNVSDERLERIIQSKDSLMLKLETLFDAIGLKEASLQSGNDLYIRLKVNLLSLLEAELSINGYNLKQSIANLYEKATSEAYLSELKLDDQSIYIERIKPNAVRLMTIHAAKGLESRVVVLAAHYDMMDMGTGIYHDRTKGTFYPGSKILPTRAIEALQMNDLLEIIDGLKVKQYEEDKRVLYVGATRAVQELIILTSGEDYNDFLSPLLTLPDLKYNETRHLDFEDYQKEFEANTGYRKLALKTIVSSYDPAAIQKILEEKKVSKTVTTLVKNEELFRDIEGRQFGKELGSLTHKVFESIAVSLFYKRSLKVDTAKLIEKHLYEFNVPFVAADVDDLKAGAVKFLSSPLAAQIVEADQVLTEIPFVLAENYHGIIDLLLLKDGVATVVDWKSDLLKVNRDEIKEHYKKQIDLYIQAVREILGKEVKGLCFYVNVSS